MKSRNYFQCAGQCCHSTCQLKAALIWAPSEQVTQACDAPSLQLAAHPSRNLQLSHVLSGWRRRREVTTSGWRKIKGTCSVWRKGAVGARYFRNSRNSDYLNFSLHHICAFAKCYCIASHFCEFVGNLKFTTSPHTRYIPKHCQYMVPHSFGCTLLEVSFPVFDWIWIFTCNTLSVALLAWFITVTASLVAPTLPWSLWLWRDKSSSLIFRHPHFHFSLKQKHQDITKGNRLGRRNRCYQTK